MFFGKANRPFWIGNIVAVEATRAEILAIAARADVRHVYLDYPIEHIGHLPGKPGNDNNQEASAGGVEPGVVAICAPEVWAMGIDGTGVLVANIDII